MLEDSPFDTTELDPTKEDYERKMKYLCRRIIDNDFKLPIPQSMDSLMSVKEKRKRPDSE